MINGEKYAKSANLFDYQTMADGERNKYLLPDGSTVESTGTWAITDYIPINGTTFTLVRTSAGNAPAICLYDDNKNYIIGVAYNRNTTVNISSSVIAKFARFSYLISTATPENLDEAMLVKGSTAPSSYIPYGNIWSDVPIPTRKYINGTWVDISPKQYVNGEWV